MVLLTHHVIQQARISKIGFHYNILSLEGSKVCFCLFLKAYTPVCVNLQSMFVGRRMFDNTKTKALHIKSLFLQYGELQNIH